jgi:hypothetical protein
MIGPSRRAARRSAPTAGYAPAWADSKFLAQVTLAPRFSHPPLKFRSLRANTGAMIWEVRRAPMHRRTLLKSLAAVPAIQFLSRFIKTKAYAADAAPNQSNRRVRPSDPTWPEPEKWEKLKQEVGGNLIKVENPLAACQGSPDSHPCQEELINLTNPRPERFGWTPTTR